MAILDINKASTTSMDTTVKDYSVSHESPDGQGDQQETYYDFPYADEYQGYYENIPELKKAVDILGIYTVGLGIQTDAETRILLESLRGWGEDTIHSILWNVFIQKKIHGDGFAEIVRDEENGEIINLKPLYPGNVRIVVNEKGIIIRYEHRIRINKSGFREIKPINMFHISNDRTVNNIHGTSVIKACKWVIDARNEALVDERKLKHRMLALGILYLDTDNATKRNALKTQYQNAVNNGEVLVLPEKTARLEDAKISPTDRLQWIQYLENQFYQALGVPRVIASSQEYSEASSKVGFLTFQPIYTYEMVLLEADIWNQLALRIKFNKPPSLAGFMQESEAANTGQTGFQQNEMQATMSRTE